jgi:hypothetical protein
VCKCVCMCVYHMHVMSKSSTTVIDEHVHVCMHECMLCVGGWGVGEYI